MNTAKAKSKPSRKARVRRLYREQGAEEAFTFGRKLKLRESTLHSWIGYWRREAAKEKTAKARARTAKRNATEQPKQERATPTSSKH
jgi:hypothetical protein